MYSQETRDIAFEMYSARDMTIRNISREMNVSHVTLLEWKKEDGWDKRKKEIQRQSWEDIDKQHAETRVEIFENLRFVMDDLMGELRGLDLKSKSKGEAVSALITTVKQMQTMLGDVTERKEIISANASDIRKAYGLNE